MSSSKSSENSNPLESNLEDLTSGNTAKSLSNDSKKKKKPFVERIGDWVCIKCKNLNFSFRIVCNRCQLSKIESEKLFDQYMKNLMNYVKINELLQNQIGTNGPNPEVNYSQDKAKHGVNTNTKGFINSKNKYDGTEGMKVPYDVENYYAHESLNDRRLGNNSK